MKLSTLTAALLLATAPAAYAGSGHDHGHSHGGSTHSHGEEAKKIDNKGAIAAASKGVAAIIAVSINPCSLANPFQWKKVQAIK